MSDGGPTTPATDWPLQRTAIPSPRPSHRYTRRCGSPTTPRFCVIHALDLINQASCPSQPKKRIVCRGCHPCYTAAPNPRTTSISAAEHCPGHRPRRSRRRDGCPELRLRRLSRPRAFFVMMSYTDGRVPLASSYMAVFGEGPT